MPPSFGRVYSADVEELRRNAREHAELGAVTNNNRGDREQVIAMLNTALATELVCLLRYRRHHFMATGLESKAVAAEFLVHANEEMEHADQLAARIVQLNGAPDFSPAGLTARSHAQYVEGETLSDMIREDLIAERIVIDSYREMIAYVAQDDSTTRRMLEGILAVEEEHADDLADLLVVHAPTQRPDAPSLQEVPPLPGKPGNGVTPGEFNS